MLGLVLLMDSLRWWLSHSTIHLKRHRLVSVLRESLSCWSIESAGTKVRFFFVLAVNKLLKGAFSKSSHCVLKLVALSSAWIKKLPDHIVALLSIRIVLIGILSVYLRSKVGIRIKCSRIIWWKHLLSFEVVECRLNRGSRTPLASYRRVPITFEVIEPHRRFTSWVIVSSSLAIQIILVTSKCSFILIKIIALFWTIIQSHKSSLSH